MKTYGEWRYSSTIVDLGTNWIGVWVNPRVGLDDVKKDLCWESNHGRPVC
jgi:hypothetical protein